MNSLAIWSVVVLACASALSVIALAGRRILVACRARRRAEATARLLPSAFALLDGTDVDVAGLPDRDARAMAELLGRLGHSVDGESRTRLASFFERRRLVDRELARLSCRREWRRAAAAHALGDMLSERAVTPLVQALGDPRRSVRAAAAHSLGRLRAEDAVEPLIDAFAECRIPRWVAAQALIEIGPAALSGLRCIDRFHDPAARALAVEIVGFLGDASDAENLLMRVRDGSAEVRAKAASALGRLGAEDATSELVGLLADRIRFVRAAAATALASVGDRDAVPALLEVAREDEFEPARAAAYAVAALAPAVLCGSDRSPLLAEAADMRRLRI